MNLEKMLERHDAGEYQVHHWTGFCKPSVTAKQAARRINAQMTEVVQLAASEGRATNGLMLMSMQANRFIADLWELSPAEFEKLRKLNDTDLITRGPLELGGMAPWLAQELKKWNGQIRLED